MGDDLLNKYEFARDNFPEGITTLYEDKLVFEANNGFVATKFSQEINYNGDHMKINFDLVKFVDYLKLIPNAKLKVNENKLILYNENKKIKLDLFLLPKEENIERVVEKFKTNPKIELDTIELEKAIKEAAMFSKSKNIYFVSYNGSLYIFSHNKEYSCKIPDSKVKPLILTFQTNGIEKAINKKLGKKVELYIQHNKPMIINYPESDLVYLIAPLSYEDNNEPIITNFFPEQTILKGDDINEREGNKESS